MSLHGFITCLNDRVHDVSVLEGFARRRFVSNAFDEVAHLSLITIGESFFGQGARPAKINLRLLHDVAG